MNSRDDSTRRNFLKAAGLALAGIVGAGTMAAAQEQEKRKPEKPKEDEPKKEPNDEDLFGNDDPSEPGEEETRACPQCGALMYRQGRTWTCETCGYSYVE